VGHQKNLEATWKKNSAKVSDLYKKGKGFMRKGVPD
jgi:hypothetical protein